MMTQCKCKLGPIVSRTSHGRESTERRVVALTGLALPDLSTAT